MSSQTVCLHCGNPFVPNPRVKNQRYCSQPDCQRARKREWQKRKLAVDPDYRANQRQCQRDWHAKHPGYYRKYRQDHPRSARRNALLQKIRNARRNPPLIATMDTFQTAPVNEPGAYYLIPVIAKMDASTQKVFIIPAD